MSIKKLVDTVFFMGIYALSRALAQEIKTSPFYWCHRLCGDFGLTASLIGEVIIFSVLFRNNSILEIFLNRTCARRK